MAQRTRRPNHRLDDVRTRGLLRSGLPATLLLAVASVAALALATAAPALAQIPGATYNGTFTSQTGTQTFFGGITLQWGTKTAFDPNAPVSFNVSKDGSKVTDVTLPSEFRGVYVGYGPGSALYCGFSSSGPDSLNLPIINGAFKGSRDVGQGIGLDPNKVYSVWLEAAGPHDTSVPGRNTTSATFVGNRAEGTFRIAVNPDIGVLGDPIQDECTTGYIPWTASTTAQPPPDGTTVEGSASAKKTQKQKGKKIVVKVKVKADEDLLAQASGKIKVKRKSYDLKPTPGKDRWLYVADGTKQTLELNPEKSKHAKKIAKVLKQGKKATAKVTVRLEDHVKGEGVGEGNRKTQKLNVKLKR